MQRKKYSASFKAKIALEMVKGHQTLNEVATKYGVHPNMTTKWKKQFLDNLPEIFSKNSQKKEQDTEKLIASLYQKIDQLDRQYTKLPFYGIPRMTAWLRSQGHEVNHKRVERLMGKMGIKAIYPKRNLSKATEEHKKYPYLLRDIKIECPNKAWASNITYISLIPIFVSLYIPKLI